MPDILAKSFDTITGSDFSEIIGWPESLQVEYKEDLPARDGRRDGWHSGQKVEQYAKDRLFKEIVAMANGIGGHLLLGVRESSDQPPIAELLVPLPRCADLAESLLRAAQSIDPPIPRLQARGIPTSDDGSGLIIFRIPQSPDSPHRSTDKECYMRRGANSVPMTMREIRDMALTTMSREVTRTSQHEKSWDQFNSWIGQVPCNPQQQLSGLHISAIPIGGAMDLGRLPAIEGVARTDDSYSVLFDSVPMECRAFHHATRERPIIRGLRRESPGNYMNLHSDGRVDLGFGTETSHCNLHMGWILGHSINTLRAIHDLRTRGDSPESEYSVRIALASLAPDGHLNIFPSVRTAFNEPYGTFRDTPMNLPELSFGPVFEIDAFLSLLSSDIMDGVGVRRSVPVQVELRSQARKLFGLPE